MQLVEVIRILSSGVLCSKQISCDEKSTGAITFMKGSSASPNNIGCKIRIKNRLCFTPVIGKSTKPIKANGRCFLIN